MIGLLLQLFATFFVIGMFTFGGGYAVIGVIQSEVVVAKGWVSESVFTDIVAISQMTPGPVGLNCSTYVGYEVLKEAGAGGLLATFGSLTASLAIVLPSFLIMLAIVKFYSKFRTTPVFQGVMSALRPAVAGLIGAAALALTVSLRFGGNGLDASIVTDNFSGWKSWTVFAVAFVLSLTHKVDPLWIIFGSAVIGLLIY